MGSHFLVSHFFRWGAGRVATGVGEGVVGLVVCKTHFTCFMVQQSWKMRSAVKYSKRVKLQWTKFSMYYKKVARSMVKAIHDAVT